MTQHAEEKESEPSYYGEFVPEDEEESDIASSPDYDYLATTAAAADEDEESLPTSSPDYDYLATTDANDDDGERPQIPDANKPLEAPVNNEYEYVIRDDGEGYILGTLMVRVLQAKNVKVRDLINDILALIQYSVHLSVSNHILCQKSQISLSARPSTPRRWRSLLPPP